MQPRLSVAFATILFLWWGDLVRPEEPKAAGARRPIPCRCARTHQARAMRAVACAPPGHRWRARRMTPDAALLPNAELSVTCSGHALDGGRATLTVSLPSDPMRATWCARAGRGPAVSSDAGTMHTENTVCKGLQGAAQC